jgi:hypothetical protein
MAHQVVAVAAPLIHHHEGVAGGLRHVGHPPGVGTDLGRLVSRRGKSANSVSVCFRFTCCWAAAVAAPAAIAQTIAATPNLPLMPSPRGVCWADLHPTTVAGGLQFRSSRSRERSVGFSPPSRPGCSTRSSGLPEEGMAWSARNDLRLCRNSRAPRQVSVPRPTWHKAVHSPVEVGFFLPPVCPWKPGRSRPDSQPEPARICGTMPPSRRGRAKTESRGVQGVTDHP